MKTRTDTRDMTVGSPWKLILGFALPLMLGNIFQQFYTFVDTMVVGQALGVNALAALGSTEWLTFMMFGFIQGLVQGFSVVMAQCFGAGDMKTLRKSVVNAVYLSMAAALIFTVAGQLIVWPILLQMNTPNEVIGLSQDYLSILYAGIPITMTYNLSAAILRALGNSRTPLQAVLIASVCNIVLDILFVFEFDWGIKGAAFATILSQILSAIFCLIKLRKIRILQFEKGDYFLNKELCWRQLKLGFPMGFQNTVTAIGGLVVQSVINSFGVLFIAGFTAANKLYGLLETPASSYGYAMTSYAGQNQGAGLFERIRKGLKAANIIGIITAILMSVIMVFCGKFILGCFITGEAASVVTAIRIGYQFLMILAVFFPLLYILYVMRACIEGIGNVALPMASSVAQLLMRVGCALFLTYAIGERGVFYGEIFAWIGADVILIWSYKHCIKKF